MNTDRRIAILVGALYIVGTLAGVLSLFVAGPLVGGLSQPDADYLTRIMGNGAQLIAGALCLLTMGLALALIPAVAFPVLKRANEALAVGYAVFRGALETSLYIGMVVCWLLLLPLAQGLAGAGAAGAPYYQATGALALETASALRAILALIFPLGALMFYAVLYQARLVPRWLSGWGLVAGVLYLVAGLLDIVGLASPETSSFNPLQMPMAVQEMTLAVWLIVKGFNPAATPSARPSLSSLPGQA